MACHLRNLLGLTYKRVLRKAKALKVLSASLGKKILFSKIKCEYMNYMPVEAQSKYDGKFSGVNKRNLKLIIGLPYYHCM